MNTPHNDLTRLVSDGGTAASHPVLQEQGAFVGPATGSEFNTIKAAIIPLACWRLEDVRFEFDSSIVRPESKTELKNLAKLLDRHPPLSKAEKSQPPELGCPLSVFGHADPTGNDDYNKQLSGRRAKAIYALITRRTELWEELFSQPFGNDKWGRRALEMMLDFVSSSEEETSQKNLTTAENGAQPVKANQELVTKHERDAGKRKALFLGYMEKLCGPELRLRKTDFLGHGDDSGGKADFQGCSEFNPVLIFSQEQQKKFDQDKDKTPRNSANASNRRVMVLIFRKGSRVAPAKWPCPRANEGVAGCIKRFWSDGEKRRKNQDKEREFNKTQDTFACRFYDRLSNNSPCERRITGEHWIIRVDKKQGLKLEDTVTLESKAVSYRSKIAVRNAVDIGEFLDFLFVPGPKGHYTITLMVGGTSYFAWRNLHLPGDGQGVEPSKFDYGPNQDHPNPYVVSSGRDPNAPAVTFNLCS
ncbi:MAG: immunoreactive 43 kDa antigen [Betaproteobacteria bacterium]|nr:immunoreactive 43 kDa antigen [Betaproteobacteria bacterium]